MRIKGTKGVLLAVLSASVHHMCAHDDGPIPIGNFALPMSQQPSPLFSFGQNIVAQHDALGYINPIYFQGGNHKRLFLNELIAIYGITDEASFFINLPAPAINKENNLFSSGFGDLFFQGEYAYLDRRSDTAISQATIVASIFFPTGVFQASELGPNTSPHIPFTGLGGVSFFLGGTLQRTTINWYMFTSCGSVFTTRHNNNKSGNSVLYQAGIGRNITHLKNQVLLLLFELDGVASNKDTMMGKKDFNSGGNVIYFGPCIYYSTKRTIFQAGVQVPVYQKLNGIQPKISYQISISLAWLFNHDDYDKR